MIGYIYKLTAPNGKIYIGQTINLKRRFGEYARSKSRKQSTLIYNSITHYGWDNFKKEILFEGECTIDLLNQLEIYAISEYNSTCINTGLNLEKGGINGLHSERTKQKMRESALKVCADKEYTKQRNAHWNGRKHSDETRKKQSLSSIGVKGRPKEFLDSIRDQALEKRRTIVLNTETGIFYDSIMNASESISMNYRTFKNKVNGSKRNTTSFILT